MREVAEGVIEHGCNGKEKIEYSHLCALNRVNVLQIAKLTSLQLRS